MRDPRDFVIQVRLLRAEPRDEAYQMRRIYLGTRISDAMQALARKHPILTCAERHGRVVGKRRIPVYKWQTVSEVVTRTTPKGKVISKEKRVQRLVVQTDKFDPVPVYEQVCEVDWRITGARQRRTEMRLNAAIRQFCRGRVGIGVVKLEYRRFADAHTIWWKEGAYSHDPKQPPPEPNF